MYVLKNFVLQLALCTPSSLHQRKKRPYLSPYCKHYSIRSAVCILHISASTFITSLGSWVSVAYLIQRHSRMPSSLWCHLYFVNALQIVFSFSFRTRHVWIDQLLWFPHVNPLEKAVDPLLVWKWWPLWLEILLTTTGLLNPEGFSNYR